MTAARAGLVALGALAILAQTGCESNQSKSAKLAGQGGVAFAESGLEITRESSKVDVVSTDVISDENGSAAVVALRNTTQEPLRQVPVAIDVTDRAGTSVFSNDDPGLEPSLTGPALLGPREELIWVNDQVLATGEPAKVSAKVGGAERGPSEPPRIELSRPRLRDDPVSGLAGVGKATNRSRIEQRRLVIYGVARRRGRIVAAGRAQIERLKPGATKSFQVFFIGNPRGARISLFAPPTTLEAPR